MAAQASLRASVAQSASAAASAALFAGPLLEPALAVILAALLVLARPLLALGLAALLPLQALLLSEQELAGQRRGGAFAGLRPSRAPGPLPASNEPVARRAVSRATASTRRPYAIDANGKVPPPIDATVARRAVSCATASSGAPTPSTPGAEHHRRSTRRPR